MATKIKFFLWNFFQVESSSGSQRHPTWLTELCKGPERKVECWPIMFTRGYTFHTSEHGKHRNSYNYGVCVKSASYSGATDDPDFYGILNQILEVKYPGIVGLKTILFRCQWFDTSQRGTRSTRWGGIEINLAREYPKNDPFILSSQADQVCFIQYPSTKRRRDEWSAVVKIKPRGVVDADNVAEIDNPLQEDNDEPVIPVQLHAHVDRLAYADIDGEFVNEADEYIVNDAEREDEFDTDSNEDDSTSTSPDSL